MNPRKSLAALGLEERRARDYYLPPRRNPIYALLVWIVLPLELVFHRHVGDRYLSVFRIVLGWCLLQVTFCLAHIEPKPIVALFDVYTAGSALDGISKTVDVAAGFWGKLTKSAAQAKDAFVRLRDGASVEKQTKPAQNANEAPVAEEKPIPWALKPLAVIAGENAIRWGYYDARVIPTVKLDRIGKEHLLGVDLWAAANSLYLGFCLYHRLWGYLRRRIGIVWNSMCCGEPVEGWNVVYGVMRVLRFRMDAIRILAEPAVAFVIGMACSVIAEPPRQRWFAFHEIAGAASLKSVGNWLFIVGMCLMIKAYWDEVLKIRPILDQADNELNHEAFERRVLSESGLKSPARARHTVK